MSMLSQMSEPTSGGVSSRTWTTAPVRDTSTVVLPGVPRSSGSIDCSTPPLPTSSPGSYGLPSLAAAPTKAWLSSSASSTWPM